MDEVVAVEGVVAGLPKLKEPPAEKVPLAQKWQERIGRAKRHYRKFHERIRHNRKRVIRIRRGFMCIGRI